MQPEVALSVPRWFFAFSNRDQTVPSMTLIPLHSVEDAAKSFLAVERAIADFRAGHPVIVEENDGQVLVVGVENLEPGFATRLDAFACGRAHLVLPSARLKRLGKPQAGAGTLALPSIDPARIETLALKIYAKLDAPVLGAGPLDHDALELARLSLVLPAVIVVPLEGNGNPDPELLTVSGDSLRRYRQDRARHLRIVSRAPVPLEGAGETEFVVFRGGEGLRDQVAVIVGKPDLSAPVTVRLHSACLTGDLFGSLKCDCGDQLRSTVRDMAANNGGVLLYLDQEGRGSGIGNKIRAYKLQAQGFDTYDADEVLGFELDQRRFDFAAEMLRQLGIAKVRVVTNNPVKIAALKQAGIDVVADQRVHGRRTKENGGYLAAKRDRAGHMIDPDVFSPCPQRED